MTRSVVEGNLNLNNERIYFTSIEKDNERHHHNLVIFQFSFKHMNRILFSILGVLFILHFQAQNMDPITIQGKTKKCKTELIKISNKTGEFTFGINKDGSVIGNMSALEGSYKMYIGEEFTSLYLRPGSQVKFSINCDSFDESIRYTGDLSAENNALAKAILISEKISPSQTLFKKPEAEFLKVISQYEKQHHDLFSNPKFSKEFADPAKKEFQMSRINLLSTYPSYHAQITKKSDFKPSASFYSFYNEFDFNNADKMDESTVQILDRYLNHKLLYKRDDYDSLIILKLQLLNQEITSSKVKDLYVIAEHQNAIAFSKNVTEIGNAFLSASNTDSVKTQVQAYITKSNKLSPGNPAPKFSLESADGSIKSLKDYLGHYVYMDIWATWCGPCIKELPFFETLKKDYANKNIKFVSVCVWDQKTAWKKFLEEKKIAGEQLFIEGQENSFVENYMVRGVPKFILIDKEGNMITNKVERPSKKELRTRFDQLMH